MSNAVRKVRRVAEKKARKALKTQVSSMSQTMADLPGLLQKAIETNEQLIAANAELVDVNEKMRTEFKLLSEEAERTLEEHENRIFTLEAWSNVINTSPKAQEEAP